MSDSGLPQPPSSGPKTSPSLFPTGKEDGQSARVEKASGALQIIKRATKIDGEVVRSNRDGSVRIRTAQGDLDVRVRLRAGQHPPKEGSRVEVELAPGRPPRQAVVRPAPSSDAPARTHTEQSPPQPDTPPASGRTPHVDQGEALPPHPSARAVPPPPVTLPLEEAPPPPDVSSYQRPLYAADIVRLLPLPPGEESQIVRPVPDIIATTVNRIVAPAVLTAILVAVRAQNEQIETILRTNPEISLPQIKQAQNPVPVPDVPSVKVSSSVVTLDSLPAQPVQVATQQLPLLPQTPAPVSVLTQAEPPLPSQTTLPDSVQKVVSQLLPAQQVFVQTPNALQNLVQKFLPDKSAALPAAQPAFRLMAPASLSQHQGAIVDTAIAARAVLPGADLLHHFPVQIAARAQPESLVLQVSVHKQAQTILAPRAGESVQASVAENSALTTARPQALDIRISNLPASSVQIIPAQGVSSMASHITSLSANPFLTHTAPSVPQSLKTSPEGKTDILPTQFLPQGNPVGISAPVIGKTTQNLPVLSLTLPGLAFPQNYVLQFNAANLPVGASVEFVPQALAGNAWHAPFPVNPGSVSEGALAPAPLWDLLGSFPWPALEEALQTMQQQPGSAQILDSLAKTTPNPAMPTRMPAAAMFFLAAVRSGDVAGWFGDKASDLLRRVGRGDILNRVGRDFAGLQHSTTDPVSQDWRAMALPLAWQSEIHKMMLYYRRGGQDDKDGDDAAGLGTRFIFDLNLTRMGFVQLDGLHRTKQKRLDLIIRTQSPVGQNMQQALRQTWVQTLDQAELYGEISFQNKPDQFVKIDLPAETAGMTA